MSGDLVRLEAIGEIPLPFGRARRYYLGMAQMVHGVDPANNEALAELERKSGPNNFFRAMAHKTRRTGELSEALRLHHGPRIA